MRIFIAILPLALLVTGCATNPRATVLAPPQDYPGFASQANSGAAWVEATYFSNHRSVFSSDLTRLGVLPVAVRVGVRTDDGLANRLADDFDPHLYLQDGTSLAWIPLEETKWKNPAVTKRATAIGLRPGSLGPWEETENRFLFFKLPGRARVDGMKVLIPYDDHYRSVDLKHSLLSLDLTNDKGSETVFAGLSSARWKR